MAKKYAGKTVWITGGGSGIGRALAVEYGRQGATVAVSGRRSQPLEETLQQIEKVGGVGLKLICDVTDEEALEETMKDIISQTGRLDVVVANAGFGVGGRLEDLDWEDWRRQFDVNVFGLMMTVKVALPHLRKTRGRIGLMGSVAGTVGVPNSGAYSASKFAVRGIGQVLTAEHAAEGISCTTLLPGCVESDIARVDNQGRSHEDWEDRRPAALMWPADRAARAMVRAIDRRTTEAVITGHGKVATFFANHAPRLTQNLMARAGQNVRKKQDQIEE